MEPESAAENNNASPPDEPQASTPPPTTEVAETPPQPVTQPPVSNNSPEDDSAPVVNQPASDAIVAGNNPSPDEPVSEPAVEAKPAPRAAPPQPAANPIELPLRAFFLIENNNGGSDPDNRHTGAAKWLFNASTKTLRIETFFPSRNSELSIDIVANSDANFPASHTVTYQHTATGENPDGPIINFPAMMVRADAGSEGKPLKGAGALIVPDKYILGLSETPENVALNLNLIDKGKWLVVPVVFEVNNRRALFVIEKGPQGERAFAAALAAWGQSDLISE
jgi:hypothetical protein